jgi:hypothetical protein
LEELDRCRRIAQPKLCASDPRERIEKLRVTRSPGALPSPGQPLSSPSDGSQLRK